MACLLRVNDGLIRIKREFDNKEHEFPQKQQMWNSLFDDVVFAPAAAAAVSLPAPAGVMADAGRGGKRKLF